MLRWVSSPRFTWVLCAIILLFIAGCSSSGNFAQDDSTTIGPEPAADRALPGLPDAVFTPHHSSNLFSGALLAEDEYVSLGATWDGSQLSLAREGISYTILGTLSPVYNSLSITLDGELDGLWLAVSDYPQGRWRWLGGPHSGSTIELVPPKVKMSPAGALYVLLVCPDGAAATLIASRSFAFDVNLLPDDLGFDPVVPEELQDAFEFLESLSYADRLEWAESEDTTMQRAFIYLNTHAAVPHPNLVPDELVICASAAEQGVSEPLMAMILEQLGSSSYHGPYLFNTRHGGEEDYTANWPRELLPADRAWLEDWLYVNYRSFIHWVCGNWILYPQ